MTNRNFNYGFTLLEVMISIVILALGVIGISLSTASAIQTSADNRARAMALDVASKTLERLYISADAGHETFKTALDAAADATVQGNSSLDSFNLNIVAAQDAAGVDALANNGPYASPVTIGVAISYAGITGTKIALASYTYILP